MNIKESPLLYAAYMRVCRSRKKCTEPNTCPLWGGCPMTCDEGYSLEAIIILGKSMLLVLPLVIPPASKSPRPAAQNDRVFPPLSRGKRAGHPTDDKAKEDLLAYMQKEDKWKRFTVVTTGVPL